MTVGQLDSRLEGGPFDGATGTVEDPPPSAIWLFPCGPECKCPPRPGDALHYFLHGQRGGERYRLRGVNDAGWAVYWHGDMDPLQLGSAARELILQ